MRSHLTKHNPGPLPMSILNRALAISLPDQDAPPISPFGVAVLRFVLGIVVMASSLAVAVGRSAHPLLVL